MIANAVSTIMFYSWTKRADVFIHRLSNNVSIGESRPIYQAGNPRQGGFTIETPMQRERQLEIQREQRRKDERVHRSAVKPQSE